MTMWLVGMMGSGKTAAGRLAASQLGVEFADTDELIAATVGTPVVEVWQAQGESRFRVLESGVVAGLTGFVGVVAAGGGAVLDEANRRQMSQGTVVWLRASPQRLADRVGGSPDRPLLKRGPSPAAVLSSLLEERKSIYAGMADHQIDTEHLAVDEVARRIGELWSG